MDHDGRAFAALAASLHHGRLGAVLALLTGALSCIAAMTLRPKLARANLTALLATATWLTITTALDPGRPDIFQASAGAAPIFMPPAVVAALVCWALSRRVLRG